MKASIPTNCLGTLLAYHDRGAYELTKETRTGGLASTKSYWYDNSGNRTKKDVGGTATVYSYDYIDRLTLAGATQYQWDTWGNLTQSGVAYNYYWDDSDRLTKFDGAGTQYDTAFTYEPGSWKRFKRDQNGSAIYFTWDGDDVEAAYNSAGAFCFGYDSPGLDDHLTLANGGNTYYYFEDGLGSARNLEDASETVQDTFDYDAWGNDIGSTNPVYNWFQYTAAYKDWYSGPMYYMRNRYYLPSVGLFASRDDIRYTLLRDWRYVRNDPVGNSDPSGWGDNEIPDTTMGTAPVSLQGAILGRRWAYVGKLIWDCDSDIANIVPVPGLIGFITGSLGLGIKGVTVGASYSLSPLVSDVSYNLPCCLDGQKGHEHHILIMLFIMETVTAPTLSTYIPIATQTWHMNCGCKVP